jgi:multicomponent Na+:H+ antiporter subunit E
MSVRVAVVVLFVAMWAGVTGSLYMPNLILGLVLGLTALWLLRDPDEVRPRLRLVDTGRLALLFVVELFKSGWRVAKIAVRRDLALRPAVVAYPLGLKSDAEITLLANLITLTPGTLSVDVSEDRRTLYIHCVDVDDVDAVVTDIRDGFEATIWRVFR